MLRLILLDGSFGMGLAVSKNKKIATSYLKSVTLFPPLHGHNWLSKVISCAGGYKFIRIWSIQGMMTFFLQLLLLFMATIQGKLFSVVYECGGSINNLCLGYAIDLLIYHYYVFIYWLCSCRSMYFRKDD